MADEHILIIDDKTEITTFLQDLLEPLGYRLSTAFNGREGLQKALREKPDLVLLDVNMPGVSGLQVLEHLQRHETQMPVILMTMYGSESVAVQAFRLGARNYITKPIDINELLVAIEWALEEGRLRRERERLVAELSAANYKLKRRMQEITILQTVGRSVASLMPRQMLLRRILDAALYLAAADTAVLFLVDEGSERLYLEAVRAGEEYGFGLQTCIQDSHAQDVLETGQPLWISRPTKRTGVTGYLGDKVQALFYVPIRVGERIVGVIGVVRRHEFRRMSTEIQNRLIALADYGALALDNSRLYEESQQQSQRLTTINHVARMIASSLDLQHVMPVVIEAVKQSLHAETASLILVDEEAEELDFEIILGDGEPEAVPFRMKVGQGIVGWVIANGQPLRVNDVSKDPRFFPGIDRATGFVTRSLLCFPLLVSDKVIGAIEAVNKLDARLPEGYGHFSEEDQELLGGIAAFASVAIQNARLHVATREAIAAQTLRDTVVTLSHHVNNPLQVLLAAAERLQAASSHDDSAAQAVNLIQEKVRDIAVVISVLQDVASPESTTYLDSIQMLDIEQELCSRLASGTWEPPT